MKRQKTSSAAPDRRPRAGYEAGRIASLNAGSEADGVRVPHVLTIEDLDRDFRIGKSLAYQLIQDGILRSALIRRPGCIKGKRVVFRDSVVAFLESCVTHEVKGGGE